MILVARIDTTLIAHYEEEKKLGKAEDTVLTKQQNIISLFFFPGAVSPVISTLSVGHPLSDMSPYFFPQCKSHLRRLTK